MALTSNDETDLLLPLYQGVMEIPRFARFLDRLKRRSGAAHVSITSLRSGGRISDSDISFAGTNLTDIARRDSASGFDAARRSRLRPNRVYTLAELADAALRTNDLVLQGIADMRLVRIPVDGDLGGLLVLARTGPCTAADSALLSNLAPYVSTALGVLHAMERDRFAATLSAGGLTRSGTGWILFDAEARVVAMEPATQRRLAADAGIEPRIGERLHTIGAKVELTLAETASRFASDPHGPGGSVVLKSDPRIDAVLVPVGAGDADKAGHFPNAVMIAYCRFATARTQERASQLAGLFDLPPREAELAMALADGQSIAEAAQTMGLTLETARNYSKRLYAQLGVRGQTGLVRLIHRSSAVLV